MRFGYNTFDEDNKQIEMIVNGDQSQIDKVTLTAIRCVGAKCQTEIVEGPGGVNVIPNECRPWSDPASWPGRSSIPQDDESIVIGVTDWICYDLDPNDAPKLLSLEVLGRLDFEPSGDRLLKTSSLFVRAG